MNEKIWSLVWKVLKITISIVLCVTATVSMLGATLISVSRDYLQSEEFHNQLDNTDLGTIKFIVNDERITVSEFVQKKASEYIAYKAPSFFPFSNYVVNNLVSSELVNTAIKTEVYSLIDYFLNSNVEEAKYRIENNITVDENDNLRVEDAKTLEEAISIYARKFVIENIENLSGVSSDNLIVLFSEDTVTKLIIVAVVLLIVVVLLNITAIFNLLLYGGFIGFLYGIIIKVFQNKFEIINEGLEDVVGYVFLKPLAYTYSSNANVGFIVGAVLIALFVGAFLLFKFFVNKKEDNEE